MIVVVALIFACSFLSHRCICILLIYSTLDLCLPLFTLLFDLMRRVYPIVQSPKAKASEIDPVLSDAFALRSLLGWPASWRRMTYTFEVCPTFPASPLLQIQSPLPVAQQCPSRAEGPRYVRVWHIIPFMCADDPRRYTASSGIQPASFSSSE